MPSTPDSFERTGAGGARLWQLAALNALASLFLLISFAWNGIGTQTAAGCTRQIIDFHVFWSAAGLALEGQPLASLNPAILQSKFNACETGWLPWLHPPAALALMTPFGLLPLVPAWVAFNAVSLGALFLALRPMTQPMPALLLAVLLAPALLPALLAGQFTTLWIAGLAGAIWCLRQQRWIAAGLLIGALTLKPTLGLLVPFALLAIGAWRTIGAAILTTVALHGAATVAYRIDYWSQLIELYGLHSLAGISELGSVATMTSFAALLARLGMPGDLAVQINLFLALALALLVFLSWRRLGPSDSAAAVLTSAIPLATPYLWHYDSAFLALSALFLARHAGFAPGRPLTVLLVLFWLGAGLSLWLTATNITDALHFGWTVPPLLLLAFATSLAHSLADPNERR